MSRIVPGLLLSSLEAAPHDRFKDLSLDKLARLCKKGAAPVIMDLKGMFEPKQPSNRASNNGVYNGNHLQQGF